MGLINTIDELEAAIAEAMVNGVQISFGPSASPLRVGQWFANATPIGGEFDQVRADSLSEALNALLGKQDRVDVVTQPVKATPAPKPATPSTSLMDLLA